MCNITARPGARLAGRVIELMRRHERTLRLSFLVVCVIFAVVEYESGRTLGSRSLMADSYHMFSDILVVSLDLLSNEIKRWTKDAKLPPEYIRISPLLAIASTLFLWFSMVQIVFHPHHATGKDSSLLKISVLGLVVNISQLLLFKAISYCHHGTALTESAYAHMFLDMFGSVAAIASCMVARVYDGVHVDLLLSLPVLLFVFRYSWGTFIRSVKILLCLPTPDVVMKLARVLDEIRHTSGVGKVRSYRYLEITHDSKLFSVSVTASNKLSARDVEALRKAISKSVKKLDVHEVYIDLQASRRSSTDTGSAEIMDTTI